MMSNEKPRVGMVWLIAAAALFIAALVFKFALVGYSMMAYVCLFACAVVVMFHFLKKHGLKKLMSVFTILLVIGCMAFAALEIPIIASARTDKDPEAKYLVVLGAGVNGKTPSLSMVNRLDAALEYLNTYPDSIAVLTGCQGEGEDISEAEAMFVWLKGRGISPERLIKEEKSTSTQENIANALDIIRSRDDGFDGRIAICSSEYHLYRAKCMAKENGCDPVGVAGKTSYPVLKLNYFIREAFGVLYMWIF